MSQENLDLMARRKSKNKNEYKQIHREIQIKCREAKEKWLNDKFNEIEKKGLNARTTHNEIKLLTGKVHTNHMGACINDHDGKLLFEKEDIKNRWCAYIGKIFGDETPDLPKPTNEDGSTILRSEVRDAMMSMKEGKAKGENGTTTEMLKLLEDFGVDSLFDLFNEICASGYIPEAMAKSVYITFPKKNKAKAWSDFRKISLMPT